MTSTKERAVSGKNEEDNPGAILDPSTEFETMQLGVWRVILKKRTLFDLSIRWESLKGTYPTIKQLTLDFYALAPILFPAICICVPFAQIAPVLVWHLFDRRMDLIMQIGLTEGKFDVMAVVNVVVARIGFLAFTVALGFWSDKATSIAENRMIGYFDETVFKWQARSDIRTSQENKGNINDFTSTHVWYTYSRVLIVAGRIVSIICQMYYVAASVSTNKEAAVHALLFLFKPFVKEVFTQSLWGRYWFCESADPNFDRMQSLSSIVRNPQYKQAVLSNNLPEYLIKQYVEGRKKLGDKSASYPASQYSQQENIIFRIVVELFGDLHMIYCFISAALHPSKPTLSTITMLPRAGVMISWNFDYILRDIQDIEKELSSTRRTYNLVNVQNSVVDGGSTPHTFLNPKGISITMNDVSFSYPGKPSNGGALNNVSFSIEAGQLIVIVGSNGSGKSTLLNLLTRLYDSTSGQVMIDGKDIEKLRLVDLRGATAVMTQDHHIYPLSMSENIGLGNPDQVSNQDLIELSARKGGAHGFISKSPQGYHSVLNPNLVKHESPSFFATEDTPLAKLYNEKFGIQKEVSGGQRQRLVAARTFMRLTSDAIKLVIADEPSSNLDPEGELELFQNLLKERQGRTMIFVTHRFGHLTRHADLIFCMKDGHLIEQGTHKELMARVGEYWKLFQVQAEAFVDPQTIRTRGARRMTC